METDGLEPDTQTYSTAIAVCTETKQWPMALLLLETMVLDCYMSRAAIHFYWVCVGEGERFSHTGDLQLCH